MQSPGARRASALQKRNGDIPQFLANGVRPHEVSGEHHAPRERSDPICPLRGELGNVPISFLAFARCAAGALELAAFYRVSANAPVR